MPKDFFNLTEPPKGEVYEWEHVVDQCGYIHWAPGNGYVYQLLVTALPERAVHRNGGKVMISVMSHSQNRFVSYPANPSAVYALDFVKEKFPVEGEEHLYFTVMLMNWAIFGTKVADDYAEELWQEVHRKWPGLIDRE